MKLRFISRLKFLFIVGIGSLAGCQGSPSIDDFLELDIGHGALEVHFVRSTYTPLGLIYESGSFESGSPEGYLNDSPVPVLAVSQHGAVVVSVRGTDRGGDRAGQLAETVSRGVDQMRANIWPGNATLPSQVDIYVRGGSQLRDVYQRRRLDRDTGWQLAFAIDEEDFQAPDTYASYAGDIAHELYHLSQKINSGSQRAEAGTYGRVLEEVTASLYGHCTVIGLGQPTSMSGEPEFTVEFHRDGVVDEVVAPLPDIWLERLLNTLPDSDGRQAFSMHIPIRITAFTELSAGDWEIAPETPAAEQLLDLCHAHAANPAGIGSWLRHIATTGTDAGLSVP